MKLPASYYIETIDDIKYDFPDIAEALQEALIKEGHCPECGGKLNFSVDLGCDVATCLSCGKHYE